MRILSTVLHQALFTLPDTEFAQVCDVPRGVETPPVRMAPSSWQCSKPLAEPEPARGYAEFFSCFRDRTCAPLFRHGHITAL